MSKLRKTKKVFSTILMLTVCTVFTVPASAESAKESTEEETVITTEAQAASDAGTEATEQKQENDAPLSKYWTADSPVAESLRNYVAMVTNEEDQENFIPVKDRIAVFDMDGTLTCETFFTYYDTMMFIDYCNSDRLAANEWLSEKDKKELKAAADAIEPGYKADVTLAQNFARAYSGMTVSELYDYAVEFGQKETASFNNMRYCDGLYLPMGELVEYLYDNDFTIYVISGTERTTTRAIVENSSISDFVSRAHMIGSEFDIKLEGNENTEYNLDYKYGEDGKDDQLIITGRLIQKNLNAEKTLEIEREIGQRPVLAFGNSGSDTSMMNYALINNVYPSQAYMVVADDTEREWGMQDWDEKSKEYIDMGYIPVSMKNDFAQIYPEQITKAQTQYQAPEAEENGTDAAEEELADAA